MTPGALSGSRMSTVNSGFALLILSGSCFIGDIRHGSGIRGRESVPPLVTLYAIFMID